MTDHYFQHNLAAMHYYRFGSGPKVMFCFHGYGMHGKQFRLLEETLGEQYTFYGFDLFFHKETKLSDQSLEAVKKGISKAELAGLFVDFCNTRGIETFSLVAYSMGSHYAMTLVEEIPDRIEGFFVAAPAGLNPGNIIRFVSTNRIGNKILERIALSDKVMPNLLMVLRKLRIIDKKSHAILLNELATAELRFSFFACASYMRFLKLDEGRFVDKLNEHRIKSAFIFGKRDRIYPPRIGNAVIPKIKHARKLVIDENHDMINANFAQVLYGVINDH